IDSAARTLNAAKKAVRVDAAAPGDLAGSVIFFRPFPFNHGFRPAVAHLLFPKSSQSPTAVMEDHGGRTETQSPSSVLDAPANIDVVSSNAELGIETADRLQPVPPKSHVASRDVLRFLVGEQNVRRSPWCMCDASSHFTV